MELDKSPLRTAPLAGYIGFQDEGLPVCTAKRADQGTAVGRHIIEG